MEFVNYEGPHDRIDTLPQILGIGRALARDLSDGTGPSFDGKYRVQRIFDPDAEGLSADIFILGEESGVDHIRNLRRIVAAYLSEAYDYEFRDAEILAEFASYYNAVHRGDMDYIEQMYQPRVPRPSILKKPGSRRSGPSGRGELRCCSPYGAAPREVSGRSIPTPLQAMRS